MPRRETVRLGVACPTCLAEVGEHCIGNGGQERVSNHRERTAAFLGTEPAVRALAGGDLQTMPYDDYLLTPEWRARRAEAIDRAGGMCQLCCSSRRLHAHHRTYARRGQELPGDITVLCEACHDLFHEYRRLCRMKAA